ncbi:MAG: trypsin-like peptidase domain-containing protein [Gemmatimonadota bacterium]
MKRTRFVYALILGLLALASALPRAVEAQDRDADQRQRLYYEVKPATVLVWLSAQADIVVQNQDGQAVQLNSQISSMGSGWLVSPDGFVVTNGHVVELYEEANEEQLRGQLLYNALESGGVFDRIAQDRGSALSDQDKIQTTVELLQRSQITLRKSLDVYLQNWQKMTAEVRAYSPPMSNLPGKTSFPWQGSRESGSDVAVLKVAGRDLPTLRIGDSDRVQIGDEIFVAGYPGTVLMHPYLSPESQMQASFTRGQVSAVKVAVGGNSVIQMDAAITHGNSGGPVFNGDGEVIGMATFGSIEGNQMVQGFNFAVPSNVARGYLPANATLEPGMFDRTWDRALDSYYARDYAAAISGFDEAIRILPNLPDAATLRLNSMQARDRGEGTSGGGSSRIPTWMILAAVALGGLLVVSGLMSRRAAAPGGGTSPGRAGAGRAARSTPSANGGPAHLIAQAGSLAGNRFSITGAGVKIGRDPAVCQVVLSDSSVSREHALVVASDGGYVVKNLSGTNPTYVNDRPIQEATLKSGDRIKVGASIFSLEA